LPDIRRKQQEQITSDPSSFALDSFRVLLVPGRFLVPLDPETPENDDDRSQLNRAVDSERNHQHIRQEIGAQSIIPAKRGKPGWKIHGVRAQMYSAFPAEPYRQRVHAETVFSAIKRKLWAKAPGRSLATQRKQALLLGLVYNI